MAPKLALALDISAPAPPPRDDAAGERSSPSPSPLTRLTSRKWRRSTRSPRSPRIPSPQVEIEDDPFLARPQVSRTVSDTDPIADAPPLRPKRRPVLARLSTAPPPTTTFGSQKSAPITAAPALASEVPPWLQGGHGPQGEVHSAPPNPPSLQGTYLYAPGHARGRAPARQRGARAATQEALIGAALCHTLISLAPGRPNARHRWRHVPLARPMLTPCRPALITPVRGPHDPRS